MSYEMTGFLHLKEDTKQLSETFKKREFVLEVQDGNYTQFPKLQLIQNNCVLLDNVNINEEMTVFFNIQGKPYTNKENVTLYFTNLTAWKIELTATATPPQMSSREETLAAIDNLKSDESESDESESDELGSDELGSDELGSDELGSDELGSDELGNDLPF
jgi:hypothetical protein